MQEQNHFFESEDHTMEFDAQDAQDAKVWSILAYFGILFSCKSGFDFTDF